MFLLMKNTEKVLNFAAKVVVNIFYNNKQRHVSNEV